VTETIEGELVTETTELAVREPAAPATVGLFNTDEPDIILAKSVKAADLLLDVVRKKGLAVKIGQGEYLKVEAWTTLGAFVGLFGHTEWSRQLPDGAGWEAAVVVTNPQGAVFGRAEAQCLRAERNWKNRDDFALRSMAQTRALGKALRMPLGFIAVLGGFEATPAEEMPAPAQGDDVPFEDRPAQDQAQVRPDPRRDTAGTGGAKTYAADQSVTELLELAARLSPEAHDKALDAIVKHRESHNGQVDKKWLEAQTAKARAKLPAEEPEQESFADKIPASARRDG
jgi:hypothetical protein